MNKIISSVLAFSALFGAQIASAQSFYQYQPMYGTGCVTITQTLSLGSSDSYTGGQVSTLQRFLVTAGYLNTNDIVGYFGKATSAAVKRFQRAQGVPVSGVVGELTRNAVQRVSCSGAYGTAYNYNYVAPTYYTTPTYNTYPYLTCGNGYAYTSCAQPLLATLNYISPTAGAVGSTVTVFGSGFSTSNNTVHFGNGIITNLGSADGRSVSFTVPAQLTGYGSQPVVLGTYPVSVTNAYGSTSGTAPFTVTSLGISAAPTISNLTGPTTIGVASQGVWSFTVTPRSGTGYITASVTWGDEGSYPYVYAAQNSQQLAYGGTQTVSFTHAYLVPGTYTITFTVRDANSAQSSTATMTVTVSGSASYGAPTIASVNPSSARVGTQIVISGSGFTPTGNIVRFGNGGMQNVSAQNGTTMLYTIPYATSPCDIMSGYVCAASAQLITPGTYPLFVTNANGTSGTIYFTVLP